MSTGRSLFPLINGSAIFVGYHLNPDLEDQNLTYRGQLSVGMVNGDEERAFVTIDQSEYQLTEPGWPEYNGTYNYQPGCSQRFDLREAVRNLTGLQSDDEMDGLALTVQFALTKVDWYTERNGGTGNLGTEYQVCLFHPSVNSFLHAVRC